MAKFAIEGNRLFSQNSLHTEENNIENVSERHNF